MSQGFATVSGKPIFSLGIGTWGIASKIDSGTVVAAHGNEAEEIAGLQYALQQGQNFIDCAELYGNFYTDEVIGQAIKNVPREDLFIGDKLWKNSVTVGNVAPTVTAMIAKLGTDYLDLLSVHAPWDDTPWLEAIPQIDDLIDQGVVRYMGLSNCTVANMQAVLKISRHPISFNQMNYNVLHRHEVNQQFTDFCNQNNIKIVAYQPLKRGAVAEHSIIQKIAQQYNATSTQIALAWLLQKAAVPIPKATSKQHTDDNLAAIKLTLSSADVAVLDAIELA